MCQVPSRPSGKTTRSPGPKLTEPESSDTVTLPLSIRQVSFSVYSQLKVLGPHFQIGQFLHLAASASEGFLMITSLTVGILFSFPPMARLRLRRDAFISIVNQYNCGPEETKEFFRQDNKIS